VNEYRSTNRTARDRAISRCIRPLTNEMLASFLSNPARRNGLAAKALTRLVAESGSSPMAVVTLLTGMSPSSLIAALPELREPAQPKAAERSSRHRHLGFDGFTVACAWCTARRGHRHSSRVSRHNPDTVCRRHRRWIGSPSRTATSTRPQSPPRHPCRRPAKQHSALVHINTARAGGSGGQESMI